MRAWGCRPRDYFAEPSRTIARQVASPSRDDLRSLDRGQVLVEHPPHQLSHRRRPVPLVDQLEDLQVARARPLQRLGRMRAGAVAQVIDVLRAFDERIGAARAGEIDVEDHVLGKIDLRPPRRAFGLLIDRRERHAQLADVLDRQEGAAQPRPGHTGGPRARIDLARGPGRHPVLLHQRQQAPQPVGRIGVVGVEAGDDVGARLRAWRCCAQPTGRTWAPAFGRTSPCRRSAGRPAGWPRSRGRRRRTAPAPPPRPSARTPIAPPGRLSPPPDRPA